MLFNIEHFTEYRFTRPVFFEPHQLRFQPRNDPSQRLLRFDLVIDPTPAGMTQALDADGNLVTMAWFNDLHTEMTIRAVSEIETLRENPFDYLLTPENRRLPVGYQPWEQVQLAAACRRANVPTTCDPVRDMAEKLREAAGNELISFLTRLSTTIYDRFKRVRRESGPAWPAATTMEERQGACRDLAVLFIDACRSLGIASRFVSGYQEGYGSTAQRDLHAWAEVYLPGAGWRGYDPAHGLAVADRHVAIAAAPDPLNAAPVTATYRGDNVETELHAQVSLEAHSAVEAAC
jgi:transglutaminase-like putative cysteine protease